MLPRQSSNFTTTPAMLCALLLGRIQIGVIRAGESALRIFAARLIRESLVAALRQEGHQFPEERFFVWYAGLNTLSDGSGTILRPPKSLCQAILTEFRHNPWAELATASEHLLRAFLAPDDFNRGQDHEDAHTVIADARRLIAGLKTSDDALPFDPAGRLFEAASQAVRFAREERNLDLLHGLAIEREPIENARWALDILAGEYLAPRHGLPVALPMPGFVVLPITALASDGIDPTDGPTFDETVTMALHDSFQRLDRWLGDAERDAAAIRLQLEGRRSSGRSHRLAEYLAGFGPMRGTQIERLISASRPGVGVMTATLEAAGLLAKQSSRNAAWLYDFASRDNVLPLLGYELPEYAPSSEAIDEYEASMRAIDDLLKRSSGDRQDD